MTQKALRNLLTRELYAYLGGPKVVLSDQVMPEAEYPYLYYQSVQQHIPGPYNQYDEGQAGADAVTRRRSEEAQASFSFTACSLDRDGPDGHRISGDDEALELADRAQGFFLFAGQRSLAAQGVVVIRVENTQSRSAFGVDETDRRYGFDVLLRYEREDVRAAPAIRPVPVTYHKEE